MNWQTKEWTEKLVANRFEYHSALPLIKHITFKLMRFEWNIRSVWCFTSVSTLWLIAFNRVPLLILSTSWLHNTHPITSHHTHSPIQCAKWHLSSQTKSTIFKIVHIYNLRHLHTQYAYVHGNNKRSLCMCSTRSIMCSDQSTVIEMNLSSSVHPDERWWTDNRYWFLFSRLVGGVAQLSEYFFSFKMKNEDQSRLVQEHSMQTYSFIRYIDSIYSVFSKHMGLNFRVHRKIYANENMWNLLLIERFAIPPWVIDAALLLFDWKQKKWWNRRLKQTPILSRTLPV